MENAVREFIVSEGESTENPTLKALVEHYGSASNIIAEMRKDVFPPEGTIVNLYMIYSPFSHLSCSFFIFEL